ncbi:ATP-binding protein [Acinetobacter junii]|uniref:AAA family ATPase n=1 Tax=Acinetobacter junii TaxID=40215 RepID=UPI0022EAB63B|nr:AAA family ATPase [Acinetobacter junii]MDA3508241.1 ATP-binding protein [Acinetobacter junii]MDA3532384.1 ATP-binding protein [Acinetobacter junii]
MGLFGTPSILHCEMPLMLFHFKTPEDSRNFVDIITPDCKYYIVLEASYWDDFGYKTIFDITIKNNSSKETYKLGSCKIGYIFQGGIGEKSYSTIENPKIKGKFLENIDNDFFSMGIDHEYYENVNKIFHNNHELISHYYDSLNDVAKNRQILHKALEHDVFKRSFLRSTSYENITDQFSAIIQRKKINNGMGITLKFNDRENLDFYITSNTKFKNNIKVLIGSNGSGKSELPNKVVLDYINDRIDTKEIKNIVLVSFSPFDKLEGYKVYLRRKDYLKSVRLISLKNERDITRSIDLKNEFIESLGNCLFSSSKKELLINLLDIISSDSILYNFKFKQLISELDIKKINQEKISKTEVVRLFDILSSGHKMVIYTLFKLVDLVDRNTLVLYDEPELYLHPPLLSAYIRAFADLMISTNAMAIITTHSPVVLQEVPKKDIKVIKRFGNIQTYKNVDINTFGERVDILTNEIFNLEVYESGYYKLLFDFFQKNKNFIYSVDDGYRMFLEEFDNELGSEAVNVILSILETYFKNNDGF